MREGVPFSFEVFVDLSVEGEGPGEEVDPADDLDQHLLPMLHIINLSIPIILIEWIIHKIHASIIPSGLPNSSPFILALSVHHSSN